VILKSWVNLTYCFANNYYVFRCVVFYGTVRAQTAWKCVNSFICHTALISNASSLSRAMFYLKDITVCKSPESVLLLWYKLWFGFDLLRNTLQQWCHLWRRIGTNAYWCCYGYHSLSFIGYWTYWHVCLNPVGVSSYLVMVGLTIWNRVKCYTFCELCKP